MAITVSGNAYTYVNELSITVGDLTGLSSKTVTATVPSVLDVTQFPLVTSNGLSDYGIGISHAWLSSPSNMGTTLNIKLYNLALATSVASDPVTFKVVVL